MIPPLPGRPVRGVGAVVLLAAGAFLAASGPEAAPAQEPDGIRTGWIGVGLTARADCTAGAGGACGPAVVGSVILGGPADEAGIQPGDTLLALDGEAIRRGAADPAFRAIRLGEPLSLRVARDGERIRIRVVPGPPPDSLAVVRLRRVGPAPVPPGEDHRPPAAAGGYALALPKAVRRPVVRAPPPAGAPGEGRQLSVLRIVPAGQAGELSREFVHARAEALREAMAAARREMLQQQQRSERQDRMAATREAREMARELEFQAARMAAEQWRSWMDDSLRAHLDVIHDSVLSRARRQLEALEQRRAPGARGAAPGPDLLVRGGGTRDRFAGAELEGLGPELSEFFGGMEDGVLVLRVLARTPAAELGLRPGDVIVEAGGRPVATVDDLRAALQAAEAESVEVKWVRKGTEMTGRLAR